MTLLALERASRQFGAGAGTITAVNDVSLAIDAGESVCIVGESGCGKTTTGRMLAGLLRPTSGRLLFEGQDVWTGSRELAKRFRRSVQLVHQDPYASLNPTRTVAQTLETPLLRHRTRDRRVARATMLQLLEQVGLTPAEDMARKYPHQLSGGQRQRVAIARALTVEPRAIVADEAVSMVDVSIRISLLDLLHGLAREFGLATVLITHDLAVARYFGRLGRVAVMYLGRVVELARTEALVDDPAHPYTAALVGAVPEADPTLTRMKTRVQLRSAETPSLAALPSGCTFHPRCPLMEPGLCDVLIPELLPLPGARDVACHVAIRERTPAAELLGAS